MSQRNSFCTLLPKDRAVTFFLPKYSKKSKRKTAAVQKIFSDGQKFLSQGQKFSGPGPKIFGTGNKKFWPWDKFFGTGAKNFRDRRIFVPVPKNLAPVPKNVVHVKNVSFPYFCSQNQIFVFWAPKVGRKEALWKFLEFIGKKKATDESFGSNVQKFLRCTSKITEMAGRPKSKKLAPGDFLGPGTKIFGHRKKFFVTF